MLKEGNPLPFLELVNGKKTREQVRQERAAIVAAASEEDLARLTNNQRSVLGLIFPPEGKGLTLQEIGRKEAFGVTHQAIASDRDGGIRKLERLQGGEPATKKKGPPKLEMDSNTRKLLLSNRHLSEDEHRKMVGRDRKVAARWRAELGIGKNPKGRPRIEMNPEFKDVLLNNNLSMGGFHKLFGHSVAVIRRWMDEANIPRRKLGRPRKSEPYSQQMGGGLSGLLGGGQ